MRLVLFYDVGQVRDHGREVRVEGAGQAAGDAEPPGGGRFACSALYAVGGFAAAIRHAASTPIGTTSAFKTSTGAEIRFFMPVLNVPFRLIFAMNPQRGNVLDNNLQPEKRFKFRFAVGTTF